MKIPIKFIFIFIFLFHIESFGYSKKDQNHHLKTKISYSKFKKILIEHNFPEYSIDKMWCIAKNESNFNPIAYNYNKNGSFDVRLFQINQIWKRWWCHMKDRDLLFVSNDVKCALVVLKRQGYGAWVTYGKFCL